MDDVEELKATDELEKAAELETAADEGAKLLDCATEDLAGGVDEEPPPPPHACRKKLVNKIASRDNLFIQNLLKTRMEYSVYLVT